MRHERDALERGRAVGEVMVGRRGGGKFGWKVLGGVLLLLGLGYGVHASGILARAIGAERDLDVVMGTVVEEWERARIGGLADLHLLEGREAFREELEGIATRRGWTDGFPTVKTRSAKITGGTAAAPSSGTSVLGFDSGEIASFTWRYDPEAGRWFITGFRLTPP